MGICGATRDIQRRENGIDGEMHTRVIQVQCTDPPHDGDSHYDATLGVEFPAARP